MTLCLVADFPVIKVFYWRHPHVPLLLFSCSAVLGKDDTETTQDLVMSSEDQNKRKSKLKVRLCH